MRLWPLETSLTWVIVRRLSTTSTHWVLESFSLSLCLLLLRGGIALETAQPYVCYTLSYCAILESGLKDLGLSREEHTSSRKLVRMPLLYRYETLSDVPVHKAWLGSLVKRAGGLRRERSTVLPCQEWSVRHCQARSCRALQRRAKPREPPEIPELLSTWNSGPYLPMDAARTPKVYQALFMPVLSCSPCAPGLATLEPARLSASGKGFSLPASFRRFRGQ